MVKLTASGIAAQLAALAVLARAGNSIGLLLLFLLLQGAAAALLALALWRLLPRRMRTPFAWSYGYLAAFCFFVPLGGVLLCLGGWVLGRLLPAPGRGGGIAAVGLPEFVSGLVARVSHGGGARLRAQLSNERAPLPERLNALAAMQAMPARSASPLLRTLLADNADDVRLLAYGMLDGAEKRLTQQILAELPRLESAATPQARGEIHKRLADLYWELIYQNLVQGDVYRHTAEQAEHHAAAALAADRGNAALWFMRGRLALARRDTDRARDWLTHAESLGFARERVVPLLAEAAYLERDYAEVRALMAAFGSASPLPLLRPVLRYWQP